MQGCEVLATVLCRLVHAGPHQAIADTHRLSASSVCHVLFYLIALIAMAEPVCDSMQGLLNSATHPGVNYACDSTDYVFFTRDPRAAS